MTSHVRFSLPTVPSHGRSSGLDTAAASSGAASSQTPAADVIHGSQVVAVGTPLPSASLPLGTQQGSVMVGVAARPASCHGYQSHSYIT